MPSDTKVTVVDIAPTILERKSLRSKEENQILYFDGDHLSDAGALTLRSLFEPIFVDLAK